VIGSEYPGTILSNDTTWTLSGSPYRLQGILQIPEGVTLTIQPGVEIIGEGGSMEHAGDIKAEGTESRKIFFNGTSSIFDGLGGDIIIRHAEIRDLHPSLIASSSSSSLTLYDSTVEGISIMGGSNVYLNFTAERNKFIDINQIFFQESIEPRLTTIRYNCFFGKPPTFYYSPHRYGNTANINFNSVYGVVPGAFKHTLKIGSVYGNIDATQNYWHGLSEADVLELIYDETVDIKLDGVVDIQPMLTQPHPSAPDCSGGN
jgi:hypothetical protein